MIALKDILALCRVSNLPTVWTNVLAAVVLSDVPFPFLDVVVLWVVLSLFYSAGMCLNDLVDAEIDKTDKPDRPIPSGRVTKSAALRLVVGLLLLPLLLLFLVYPDALLAGLILTGLIILYDLKHKSSALTVYVMAGCRLMVFVIGGMAVAGNLGSWVIAAGLLQFFYVIVLSLVARHENNRSDPFAVPVIPRMIAGISLLDGLMMSLGANIWWLTAGLVGALLTLGSQRYVRGD